jgi:TolA-binding protein
MRNSLKVLAAVAVAGLLLPAPKAHAVSKEIIQLQVQVQALQNAVQHLQQTDAEQMGAIQNIVQQTSNTVIQMNQTISALQNQLQAQQQSGGGAIQQVSTQIQSLNDSVDELRTRIEKLSHQMDQVESQLQNVQQPAATPGSATSPNSQTDGQGQTAPADSGNGAPQPQAAMQQPAFPPIQQLYQVALSDYEGARYKLAASEFGDVVKDYPLDELSGSAQFYIGEANYHLHNYHAAIKAYEAVLQNFAGNPKAPASRLHKAYAELALGEHEAGVHDLKALIARYPQTPEASQARVRLRGLAIRSRRHSSASRGM